MFENHHFFNSEILLDSGDTYRVSANWIHNQHLDRWQGWQCNAGHKRLLIDENFNVFSGECLNDTLGNVLTGWKLLPMPTTCHQSTCTGCTDDLLVEKFKP